MKDNHIESGQVIQENIPADELQPTPSPNRFEDEEQKFISFFFK